MTVSVLGLGAMGTALAAAFVRAGQPTTGWNRSPEKTEAAAGLGVVRAETVADAVGDAELVVVCLLDHAAVREVLEPVAAQLTGRVLLNVTNGTAEQVREVAAWAAEHGASYVDGGIMAIPPSIGQAESVVLYSGSREAYDRWAGPLGAWGTGTFLGEDPGLAALHDLALLGAMYGMFAGAFHATAMVGTEGVAAGRFTTELLVPWLHSMVDVLPMLADAEVTAEQRLVEQVALANIIGTAAAQGVPGRLTAPLKSLVAGI
ncbi:NAD(P)-dependent oxidoreductase [Amycolatopsis sp. 195334CR]|uniref:NAD(P)-dependent oxidoreductase n=1 Tax=Amycolatopsis sp. 195334CR TaxID=2814588 RepID=UPI001A8FBD7A|nr:NAD(P)-binding domain-containing protein [Amycolatopsis sp. 195334CR]MBN6038213.1 NAD(P)-dependent oxidoreductase [Amycolatopsis sp. 195334CR]